MKLATVRLVALAIFLAAANATADDVLKLAIGQRGNWENAAPELGQKAGFFKKRGLTLELLYTQGAGETMQAVISGSVDLGVGVGTAGVLGAFAKGAPVRAIANSMTGADDLFWYVPAASPIKTLAAPVSFSAKRASRFAPSSSSERTSWPAFKRLPRSERQVPKRSGQASMSYCQSPI